jgi:hypothetical protein
MAAVTREIARMGDPGTPGSVAATLSITYDDVSKVVSQVAWTVAVGTLTLTLHQSGKQDLVISRSSSGSQALPAGYTLDTLNQAQFEISWSS